VLEELLTRVWRALSAPDNGGLDLPLAPPTSPGPRRRRKLDAHASLGTRRHTDHHTADMSLNAISALPYEGRAGTGKIVLAARTSRRRGAAPLGETRGAAVSAGPCEAHGGQRRAHRAGSSTVPAACTHGTGTADDDSAVVVSFSAGARGTSCAGGRPS